MQLQRFRYYSRNKNGVGWYAQQLHATHDDVQVEFQDATNSVIATFPDLHRVILCVHYPQPLLEQDECMHAYGYVEFEATHKGKPKKLLASKEHWVWK